MIDPKIQKAMEGVVCNCGRSNKHIMGCNFRSRDAAVYHFVQERIFQQSVERYRKAQEALE